jgi:transcription elongation GreA/GreB family factor
MRKGLMTTVQESKGKFTTPIPMGLVALLGIQKGDKFNWTLREGEILVRVVKS